MQHRHRRLHSRNTHSPGRQRCPANNQPSHSRHLTQPRRLDPKELDFGIETSTSAPATRTVTITNFSSQPQNVTSKIGSNQLTPYAFATCPRLPRYLYLSNNSDTPITHTPVTRSAPFTLTDRCPTTLPAHTLCQLDITYQSPIAPSADSTTLTLDQGLTALITGTTKPLQAGVGQIVNPNLTVTPTTITFPVPVPVTSTSAATQSITIGNTGTQPFALTLSLSGDFTDTTDCPALLSGNTACTVLLTFAPSQTGHSTGHPQRHRWNRHLTSLSSI